MKIAYEQYLNELRKKRAAVFYFAGLESLDYENVPALEKWLKRELMMAVRVMLSNKHLKDKTPLVHVVAYGGVKGIGRIYDTIHRFKIDHPQIGKMFQTVALGSESRLSYLDSSGQLALADYIVHTPDIENTGHPGHPFVTNKLLQAALPGDIREKLHASSDLLCRSATVFSWGFFVGGDKTVNMQVNQLKKVQSIATDNALIRVSLAHTKGLLEPNRANLMSLMQKEDKETVRKNLASLEEFLEGSGITQLSRRAEDNEKRSANYQMLQALKRGDNLAGVFLREERSALMGRFIREQEPVILPPPKKQSGHIHNLASTLPSSTTSISWGGI